MALSQIPISELSVANMAATTLDDKTISSLDDGTSLAKFIKAELPLMKDELLELHPWAFAKKYAYLPVSESHEPPFGWDYAYDLPSDCVRPLPLRVNGALDGDPIPYEWVGQYLYTDYAAPLPLVYIERVNSFGRMTPLFARALGQYVALGAAQRVTGKVNYLAKAQELFKNAMDQAIHVNSLSMGTPASQYRNKIISVRGRG